MAVEVTEVKEAIARRKIVEFGGIRYYPVAYRLTLNDERRAWNHTLELHDLRAKSITVAPLKNIKIVEDLFYEER